MRRKRYNNKLKKYKKNQGADYMTTITSIESHLEKAGISKTGTLHRNLSYDDIYQHEIEPSLKGFERSYETGSGKHCKA